NVRDLITDFADASSRWGGVWSRAGGGYIFEVTRRGSTDLWRLRENSWFRWGAAREQLTAGPLDFGSPAAIPGRSELIVTGTRRLGSLKRFDRATGKFLPYLDGISAEMTDFSRDGQWVVYSSFPDLQLWRRRVDGSEALPLTQAPWRAGAPRISPDGKYIAFTGDRGGDALNAYIVPFAGGTPVRVTDGPSRIEVAPTWSPDSAQLLIRSDRPGTLLYNNVLQIVDLRTRRLTTIPDSTLRFNQRWSPDGNFIAATPNDESELDLFDLRSGRWSVLAKMRADYPNWTPDGKYIYFVSNADAASSIYRVSLESRQPELIASLAQTERAIDDVWGQWAGVTPDGAPLVMENADLQQIYMLTFEP
ncbi:MAG: PD40 domain-containing protein, partial [Acidobacteriota bacterium]|nr:PD40 domain-containing protein [Acidobacteriota bacterium]